MDVSLTFTMIIIFCIFGVLLYRRKGDRGYNGAAGRDGYDYHHSNNIVWNGRSNFLLEAHTLMKLSEEGHNPRSVVSLDKRFNHEGISAVGDDLILTATREGKLYTVRVSNVNYGPAKLHDYYYIESFNV